MDRPNNPNETKYLLIGEEEFERLLRSYYILGKGLLAFEYLCGHSDRPMYLSAEGVCEVLGITRDELDEHRLKRQIKAKVFQRQMMYSLYDLVVLSERLQHQITTLKNAPLRCRRQMIVIRVVPPLFKTGCKRSVFFSDFVKATKQQQEERRYRQIISDLPVRFEGSLAELFEQRHQFQCGFASPYFGDYSP